MTCRISSVARLKKNSSKGEGECWVYSVGVEDVFLGLVDRGKKRSSVEEREREKCLSRKVQW